MLNIKSSLVPSREEKVIKSDLLEIKMNCCFQLQIKQNMHEESVAVDVSQLTAGVSREIQGVHQSPEGKLLLITTASSS